LPQFVDGGGAVPKNRHQGLSPGDHLSGTAGGSRWRACDAVGRSFGGEHGISLVDGKSDGMMVEQRPCHAVARCRIEPPKLREISPGRSTRCRLTGEMVFRIPSSGRS
jgi:hypothetical protein